MNPAREITSEQFNEYVRLRNLASDKWEAMLAAPRLARKLELRRERDELLKQARAAIGAP